jgi:hypothetical protein
MGVYRKRRKVGRCSKMFEISLHMGFLALCRRALLAELLFYLYISFNTFF